MREVNGSELLGGSDHEFVVNLYTVILNRWPDEEGYQHHLQKVENRPDLRRQIVTDVAGSQEARSLGVTLRFDDAPPPAPAPPRPAAAPLPAMAPAPPPATDLAATLARFRDGIGALSPSELAAAQRALAETLAALAAHQAERIEKRLAALEAR